MKRILILTFFYPPASIIAGHRPYSWATNFKDNNIYPTIITRHWNGDEKTWQDCLKSNSTPLVIRESDECKEYLLPFDNDTYLKNVKRNSFVARILRKLSIFSNMFFSGNLSADNYAGGYYDQYIIDHLKKEKYDAILVTAPPISLVKLAYKLNKLYHIPYFIDFRDLWNFTILKKKYRLGFTDRIYFFYFRKWLKNATCIFAVSQGLLSRVAKVSKAPRIEITNGYEKDIFSGIAKKKNERFTMSFVGTLYNEQKTDILLAGVKKFIDHFEDPKFTMNFIGTATNSEICRIISDSIPSQYLNITDRVSRKKALEVMKNSELLFSIAWHGYEGIYSGKIFEYIASGNNVLIAPGDDECISNLIDDTNAGYVASNAGEVFEYLSAKYLEWQQGDISYQGKQEKIDLYSREEQASKMSKIILNYLH